MICNRLKAGQTIIVQKGLGDILAVHHAQVALLRCLPQPCIRIMARIEETIPRSAVYERGRGGTAPGGYGKNWTAGMIFSRAMTRRHVPLERGNSHMYETTSDDNYAARSFGEE